MELHWSDIALFAGFFALVIGVSLYKSRREKSSEDYFLASRGLIWPLIGFSIVAANLSTEQFVGMAGQGAGDVGLAVSAWQLTGAAGIVIIAFTLLPRFLKAGIYTMPEYLEYRYNALARAIMAFLTMVIYVTVTITAVLYSGGLTLSTIFDVDLALAVWIIGGIAAIYTTWGGLKAVAWADLFQGAGLMIGGLVTMYLVFEASGGVGPFFQENADQLHMILPKEHPTLPWTGVLAGMWIPIVYYCGLNQFIVQRTLAAKNLRQGQLGILFAAALWLLVPFAIVIPGIAAKRLYKPELAAKADEENAEVLASYRELQTSAGQIGKAVIFKMDAAWQARHPDRAKEISGHNARVLERAEREGLATSEENLVGYKYDAAYPVLIRELISPGIRGLMFAAIAGAVISSLASMLNSASTIFTMDLYRRLFAVDASQRRLVTMGRVMTLVFVVAGCLLAPALGHPQFKGVFNFIQEFQGYISPGIVATFLVGFVVRRAPPSSGVVALLVSAPIYGLLHYFFGDHDGAIVQTHYLIRMMITFCAVTAIMLVMRLAWPLAEPRAIPAKEDFDARTSPLVVGLGALVIAAVVAFFVVFR
jgi:SSS family solute:Na+ symporter